jgi:hypothetical protein
MRTVEVVMRAAIGVILMVVGSAVPARAQEERYLLLAASRTSTLQNEINQAVERGFRVVAASRTDDAEALVALERTTGTYTYRVIAATRTGTLQREIAEAVAAGFRVVPRTVTTKRTIGGALFNNDNNDEGELLVIMERGPDTPANLTYRILATSRTGTLQREMSDAEAAGFTLIALASRGEHVAIFERVGRSD